MSTNPRTDYEDLKLYLEIKRLKEENVALKKKLAEPKWKAGHPEKDETVLVKRQNVYAGGCKGIERYEVARWNSKFDNWLFNDDEVGMFGYERQVLGWKEIEPFDLEEEEWE